MGDAAWVRCEMLEGLERFELPIVGLQDRCFARFSYRPRGAHDPIRTGDALVNGQVLYPAELRVHGGGVSITGMLAGVFHVELACGNRTLQFASTKLGPGHKGRSRRMALIRENRFLTGNQCQ